MRIQDIQAPLSEPVDLAYAKTFLRVDTDDEDALIADMITSARLRIESLSCSSLISRRRLYRSYAVHLPTLCINHSPVTAVYEFRLIDQQGAVIEVPRDHLSINLRVEPSLISLTSGTSFRGYATGITAIEVEIEAGYGAQPDTIPMPLRQAILLLVAKAYEHRGGEDNRPSSTVPMMVEALLMPYRSLRL